MDKLYLPMEAAARHLIDPRARKRCAPGGAVSVLLAAAAVARARFEGAPRLDDKVDRQRASFAAPALEAARAGDGRAPCCSCARDVFDDETREVSKAAEGVVGSACRGVGAVLPSSAVGFLGRHLSPSTFPCAAILQPATFGAKLAIEVVEKQKRK